MNQLLVSFQRLQQILLHRVTQPQRFQHFYLVCLCEQLLQEVEGGVQLKLKIGILRCALQLLLRVVQRECAQVVGKWRIGTNHDAFYLFVRMA